MVQHFKFAVLRRMHAILLGTAMASLVACGGEDGNTAPASAANPSLGDTITNEQAQLSARDANEPLKRIIDVVSSVIVDSKSADLAMRTMGSDNLSLSNVIGSKAALRVVTRRPDKLRVNEELLIVSQNAIASNVTSTGNKSVFQGGKFFINALLNASSLSLFSNPSRDGDTVTYHPEVNVVCSDDLIAKSFENFDPVQAQIDIKVLCETLVPNFTVVQTLNSVTTGTLTYQYRSVALLVVEYAQNIVYFELQLPSTKTALQAMAQDLNKPLAEGDLPSTFDGAIRLAATETGANAGFIRLSVPEAIAVSGAMDLGEASFTLAASDKLLEIGGDETAGTAYVEMDIGAIAATLPDEDANGTPHLWELAMAAMTGRIDVNNNTQQLTVTNLGLGDAPTTVRIDGQEALRVAMQSFGATVDGNTSIMKLDTVLDFSMNVANVFGMMDVFFLDAADPSDPSLTGSLEVSAPAGTELSVLNPDATTLVTKVTAGGPIEIQGGGAYEGTLSLPVDSCFVQDDSSVMPVAPTPCP